MTTKTRQLSNIDGASVAAPTQNGFTASGLETFANDAAFEAVHGAGTTGDIYLNTTTNSVRVYKNSAWQTLLWSEFDTDVADDSSTGTNLRLVPTATLTRLTTIGGGDTVAGIDDTNVNYLILINDTANAFTLLDDSTNEATASYRVYTGSGSNLQVLGGTSLFIAKDQTEDRWRVVGGSGAGLVDPMTTRGDIIVRDATNTSNRLAIGTGGQYLRSDGTDIAWEDSEFLNLILNANGSFALDRGATDDIGDWIDSGAGTTASVTTTASEIALEDIKSTGIKITLAAGTNDYTRVRFQVPAALQNQNLSLSWDQRVSGLAVQDMKVELYNYSDNYVSDVAEVTLFSDDTSGDTFIAANDSTFKTAFSANGREYYELRFINNGGTSGYLSLNSVTINNNGGANGALITTSVASGFTFNNLGSVTSNLEWSRHGEYMHIVGDLTTGTVSGSTAQIVLPNNLTAGFKGSVGSNLQLVGHMQRDNVNAVDLWTILATDGSSNLTIGYAQNDVSRNKLANSTGTDLGNSLRFSLHAKIPIAEWSGAGTVNLVDRGVTQSNLKWRKNGTDAPSLVAGGYQLVKLQTDVLGDSSSYDVSTGVFTAPSDGIYFVEATLTMSVSGSTLYGVAVKKNDTSTTGSNLVLSEFDNPNGSITSTVYSHVGGLVECVAGDQLSFHAYTNAGTGTASSATTPSNAGGIFRVADHSAIAPLGFGTTDEADTSAKYLLPRYQTETVTLDSGFTGGTREVTCVRIGNMVTISGHGAATHASASSVVTSSGLIPPEYRPTQTQYNVYHQNSSASRVVQVAPDGLLAVSYANDSGGSNNTTTVTPINISYVIT